MAAGKTANELRLETLKAELLSMPTTDPRYKAIAREASDTLFKISDERRKAAGLPTLEQALQQRAEERLKNPDAQPRGRNAADHAMITRAEAPYDVMRRVLIATATVLLLAISPAIAQSPPTGAAYLEYCGQRGVPPENCTCGPGIFDTGTPFSMDNCLHQGIPQWRCNLIDYCFKKKDPSAAGGECARGYAKKACAMRRDSSEWSSSTMAIDALCTS